MRRSLFILLLLVLCVPALIACGGSQSSSATPTAATTTAFGHPSTSFQLTGLVSHPGTFNLADLQAFPKVTVTINAHPIGAQSFEGVQVSLCKRMGNTRLRGLQAVSRPSNGMTGVRQTRCRAV